MCNSWHRLWLVKVVVSNCKYRYKFIISFRKTNYGKLINYLGSPKFGIACVINKIKYQKNYLQLLTKLYSAMIDE